MKPGQGDVDYWMFRGFGGVVGFGQQRAIIGKGIPFDAEALEKLREVALELESLKKRFDELPLVEIEYQAWDWWLVECFLILADTIRHRLENCPKLKLAKDYPIFASELGRIQGLIRGLEEHNRRCKS